MAELIRQAFLRGIPTRAVGRVIALLTDEPERTPGRNSRMRQHEYTPIEPVVPEVARKILRALRNGPVPRRTLQQKMWRHSAKVFNQAIRYLADRGQITLYGD